ncbi:succinylglutamate desuccinylase/aspartoacylase family protein [Pedobacter sp. PLR]|uniref:succinylglutamate desuccinylase/aspartoacylase family protein n=1 Tax=Pedobacter sp. PLR TaxID=2994465 RepID=UPI00224640DA|nr:succinylglutamate desuccinylase/aspartoacylase family protein [Pedobacter sp. PLR]MCX2452337.1 succinylglutamate desuccinylase/aspartoacylase family protein [Pedobacter sp. PLR]
MEMCEIDIQSDQEGPKLLILAGVHGDEYEPILAAIELSVILKDKLKKGTVQIVPVVNKSAYYAGTRCGTDGLDLARSCPGNLSGSSTMQDAANVSKLILECDYLIDLHTGGQLFDLFPLAGYMLHPNQPVLDEQRKMAKAFGLPLVWGTDPLPEGRTLSIARDANIPAIYVEYAGPGPVKENVVNSYINGCLNVLALFDMLTDHRSEVNDIQYTVEDYEPDSGFLQQKMLSPTDGIFVPKVLPGEIVKRGQLWGLIYALPLYEIHQVYADADGLVLFIRSQPRVNKEESLGGILSV